MWVAGRGRAEGVAKLLDGVVDFGCEVAEGDGGVGGVERVVDGGEGRGGVGRAAFSF